jgi:hypothetical protein
MLISLTMKLGLAAPLQFMLPHPAPVPPTVAAVVAPAPAPISTVTTTATTTPAIPAPKPVTPPATSSTTTTSGVTMCLVSWQAPAGITNPNQAGVASTAPSYGEATVLCSQVQEWEAQPIYPAGTTFTVQQGF